MEEVEKLQQACESFQGSKMAPIVEKVETLKEMMNAFEAVAHYDLNRLRSIWTQLEIRWNEFETNMEIRTSNLKLSLSFQDNVFEGSNWCQQSEQLLQGLEERMSGCDTSLEVSNLSEELSAYLTATKEEQQERVTKVTFYCHIVWLSYTLFLIQIKQISMFLHSNFLVELSVQVEASTQSMIRDIDLFQQDLHKLCKKLIQIEEEKDRERRLMKQKELVASRAK